MHGCDVMQDMEGSEADKKVVSKKRAGQVLDLRRIPGECVYRYRESSGFCLVCVYGNDECVRVCLSNWKSDVVSVLIAGSIRLTKKRMELNHRSNIIFVVVLHTRNRHSG